MNVFSSKYRNVILGVTATAFGYYAILMPHTIFLNKYRYITARYQIGKEVPLSLQIRQRIQQVMDDLKLPDNVRNIIRPYSSFGFDLFHAGTVNPKYGAILGIPANFTNTAEHLRTNLQIKEEPIDWTQKDAQIFLDASMLSDNAQKFAIANEILRIQAEEPYFNSVSLALVIGTLWILYNAITYRYKLRSHNVTLCRTLYSAFTVVGAILWFGIKDYQSYRLDSKNDKILCSFGAEYIRGGQEFYEKTLIRNIAMRSLLGTEGEKIYTANGNEQILLRQKRIPLSHKKDLFDAHLKNLGCKT